jgi:hypothetical protein
MSKNMRDQRKITVRVPANLLEMAQAETGAGIAETIRLGLEILAASQACDQLIRMRGKVRFSQTWKELKDDR